MPLLEERYITFSLVLVTSLWPIWIHNNRVVFEGIVANALSIFASNFKYTMQVQISCAGRKEKREVSPESTERRIYCYALTVRTEKHFPL